MVPFHSYVSRGAYVWINKSFRSLLFLDNSFSKFKESSIRLFEWSNFLFLNANPLEDIHIFVNMNALFQMVTTTLCPDNIQKNQTKYLIKFNFTYTLSINLIEWWLQSFFTLKSSMPHIYSGFYVLDMLLLGKCNSKTRR